MSLDKGIKHGKERRREYRGSARFDRTCRPGAPNPCPYCERARRIAEARLRAALKLQEEP